MANNWYCRRVWTPEHREDFFRRLDRSRTPFHKAQYAVIQGESLARTGRREACLAAIGLLEMALTQWPKDVQTVRAQFAMADCYVKLGDQLKAVETYHEVVKTQRRDPYWLTDGPMEFAWLVAILPMPKLFKGALAAVKRFPPDNRAEQRFLAKASRAFILAASGSKAEARDLATAALKESKSTRSAFAKTLRFTGKLTYEQSLQKLRKLAAGQTKK